MNNKIVVGILAVVGLFLIGLNVGINNAGQRTVIQSVGGDLSVKFDSGIYFPFFGKVTEYNDFLTYDFSPEDNSCDFEQKDGLRVRYQDGGEGVICGMVNVQLPNDELTMIKLHKRFRSEEGVRSKLLNQSVPKAFNLTAALMSSEEAYATKRSEYIRMSREQTAKGIYKTVLTEKSVVVGIDENGKAETQLKDVPVVVFQEDGVTPITTGSDLTTYGITLAQFDPKAWDFEPKTITQIQDKRAAEMAIVTAKANAKKAYWLEQQVRADGKKNVATAEFAAKVLAEKQIQEAERNKQLALIEATQVKERAVELTLAAIEATKQKKQEALQAVEEAKVITTLAKANAFKIQKEQEAGELKLRLDNSLKIATVYAQGMSNMKVPATMIVNGASGSESNSEMNQLLQLQVLKSVGGMTPSVK